MSDLDLQSLTAKYFGNIHRAALVLTGNPWDADDLAQETFLVLARQLATFQGRSGVYTFIYGILLNLERRERRRRLVRQRGLRVLCEGEAAADRGGCPAETPVEVAEWNNSLWAWVRELPDGQRQALVLRFSEGLRYEEIAAALECPLGTVKSRISLGLASLRRMLAEAGPSGAAGDWRENPALPRENQNHAV